MQDIHMLQQGVGTEANAKVTQSKDDESLRDMLAKQIEASTMAAEYHAIELERHQRIVRAGRAAIEQLDKVAQIDVEGLDG